MEHRWGERLSVRTRVALRARGGLQGIGYIRDVSISGALVVSSMHASSMSFVRISLPAGTSAGKSLEGQVVRHTTDGFAVEWSELAPELVRSLLREDRTPGARGRKAEPAAQRPWIPPRKLSK